MATTPVFLPGKSHAQKSLEGCSSWGHKELDMARLLGEAHGLKPPTLARHHSNHLHELFYDRRS